MQDLVKFADYWSKQTRVSCAPKCLDVGSNQALASVAYGWWEDYPHHPLSRVYTLHSESTSAAYPEALRAQVGPPGQGPVWQHL